MPPPPADNAALPIFDALNESVAAANRLPLADDAALIRTLSDTVDQLTSSLNADAEAALRNVAAAYSHRSNPRPRTRPGASSPPPHPPHDVFAASHELVERSIEQFNLAMDDHNGLRAQTQPATFNPRPGPAAAFGASPALGPLPAATRFDMRKPQLDFPDHPIDNSTAPFVPPYVASPKPVTSNPGAAAAIDDDHPYEAELAQFVRGEKTFSADRPIPYPAVERTPFSFISTEEQLAAVAERLKKESEIAIDLENHSDRSYQGFICLMQVSTREEDFVIDALKLRGCIHRYFAPLFLDKSILKVLHGADHDIEWLERDFGIYVVGLFDTGQAARLLGLKSASLSFLLQHYCNINASDKKRYQLADWRLRPLPHDMMAYARADTHYLLYIYDMVRGELARRQRLDECWSQSADICRKRYRKPSLNPKLPIQVSVKQRLRLKPDQLKVLGALFEWRDKVAREEDESPHFVAPVKCLVRISQNGLKCRNKDALANVAAWNGVVPPLLLRDACPLACIVRNSLKRSTGGLL